METFGDYAEIEAPSVARVFLPLVDEADPEQTVSWRELQDQAPIEFSGDISWVDYLGWGSGTGSFASSWRPSMGRAPGATIGRVVQLLTNVAGNADDWVFRSFPQISPIPGAPSSGSTIDLAQFAALWIDRPLPGSIRFSDSVSISAPAYADSVIVSGPSSLVDVGNALGLEIRAVSRRTALPAMVW